MKKFNAKLGRGLTAAHNGSNSDITKRIAALTARRQEGTFQRFVQSLDGGRFEFAGLGLETGNYS